MNLIWTIDHLERWTKSEHSRVRCWAIDRLKEQFPDQAGPIMTPLLSDPDDSVATNAASFFVDHPNPTVADSLFRLFQRGSQIVLWQSAKAMSLINDFRFVPIAIEKHITPASSLWKVEGLLRLILSLKATEGPGPATGITALHDFLEQKIPLDKSKKGDRRDTVSHAMEILLSCKKQEEMAYLIRYLLALPSLKEWGYIPLLPFIDLVGGNYEEEIEKEIEPKLRRISSAVYQRLPKAEWRLWEKATYVAIIGLLHRDAEETYQRAREAIPPEVLTTWEQQETRPFICLRLLRAFVESSDLIAQATPLIQKRFAMVFMAIHHQFMDAESWMMKLPEQMTTEEQMNLLLASRSDMDEDKTLINILSQATPPEPLIERALREMRENPDDWGALRAIQLLGRLRAKEALPILFHLLQEESDDLMADVVEEALHQYGEIMLPHIEAIFQEGDGNVLAKGLYLLGDLPYAETVGRILSQINSLQIINREALLDVIERIGAADFIPFIKKQMRAEEPEEEVYLLLCRLHGVDDPELSRIETFFSDAQQRMENRMSQILSGGPNDETDWVRNEVALPLCCLDCGHTYTYSVREAWMDPEVADAECLYIPEEIICKGCQSINRYNVTPQARLRAFDYLSSMYNLIDAGKAKPNEGAVQYRPMMVDGRRMSAQKGLTYYREKIEKAPNDPSLRIGYGNLLLFLGRIEEARVEFEKGVALDPFAIEAIDSLARIAIDDENPEEGYRLIEHGLVLFNQGNFYRLAGQTKENLLAYMEKTRLELQKELGIPSTPLSPPVVRAVKIGRNDPCPCGSGKKYKKCCIDTETPSLPSLPPLPETMMGKVEQSWLRRIMAYAHQPKFERPMMEARTLFFQNPTGTGHSTSNDDGENETFLDWFVHDYRLEGEATLIEGFLKRERVSQAERELALDAIGSVISLYEVQDVRQEKAEIVVKDIFTDEQMSVHDVAGSKQLVKWDLIGVRIFRVEGLFRFSGIITPFQLSERGELVDFLTDQWKAYQKEKSGDSWKEFMKARGYLLYQQARHLFMKRANRVFLTSEGHEVVICKAIYDVLHFHGALIRMREAFDFYLQKEEAEEVRFDWLKRGESTFLIPEGETQEGLVLTTQLGSTSQSEGRIVLGTCMLTPKRLTLETQSHERLTAGKGRIEKIVGDSIRFRVDSFEPLKTALKKGGTHEKKPFDSETAQPVKEALTQQYFKSYYERWLHEAIPALDGKSPLEMVKLPGGRARVEPLLKQIEHGEERRRREGQGSVDMAWLWKELGF